jgi:diguanylate cyclase (GGDEF)-like protein
MPNTPGPKPSTGPRLRLLLVEDSRYDARIVRQHLKQIHGDGFELRHVRRLAEVEAALDGFSADCILLDLSLPDAAGTEGVTFLLSVTNGVPIVVLSVTDDHEVAISAVRLGAQDFLVKGRVDAELLNRSIRYAIERKGGESQLAHQALHDAVTGLPNRTLFTDRLRQALAKRRRSAQAVAVMFLDLDRFKAVNDQFGHDAGDDLLIEVSRRLQALLRPTDTVARFGGDEFVILCEQFDTDDEAAAIAGRVVESVSQPFRIKGKEVFASTSVGVALAIDSSDPGGLIQAADLALYHAKENGQQRYEFFDDEMRKRAVSRAELQYALHRAVEKQEFQLVYQPLVELATGEIIGGEALARWRRPRHGVVEPEEFIPLAEEIGLIVPIGALLLTQACTHANSWRDGQRLVPNLSVNVSARQLGDPKIARQVEDALAATKLAPSRLCLEITESAIMNDLDGMRAVLHGLKGLGVTLSVDDFGTGYSSLSLLRRLPFDQLKIDRSFVDGLHRDPQGQDFVAAIIGLAKTLRLSCLAEGIESLEQLSVLRNLGCELGQGFYFSRPLSSDGFARLATSGDSRLPN